MTLTIKWVIASFWQWHVSFHKLTDSDATKCLWGEWHRFKQVNNTVTRRVLYAFCECCSAYIVIVHWKPKKPQSALVCSFVVCLCVYPCQSSSELFISLFRLDTDPRVLEKQELQQPTYVALSYINRYSTMPIYGIIICTNVHIYAYTDTLYIYICTCM